MSDRRLATEADLIRPPTLHAIMKKACEVCWTPRRALFSHRRYWQHVRARFIFYYAARELTDRSYPEIARYIGRDHSTLVHGVQRVVANREKYEPELSLVLDYFVKSKTFGGSVHSGHIAVPAVFFADSVC